MRKACIVFLAILIAVTGCFVSLHCAVLGVADDVTVTRHTLHGDPATADGLNILIRNHYDQNLLWETALALDSDPVPVTQFTFSNAPISIPSKWEVTGVEFQSLTSVFVFDDEHLPESAREKYADVIEAFTTAVDSVPAGQSKTFTMNLAEYIAYYPLEGFIIVPGCETYFSEFEYWTSQSEEVSRRINDYFRIPMDGEYMVEYTIDKTNSGASYGASSYSSYSINGSGVTTDKACYFTFNTVMDDGSVADTSLIPGGYGIYRLPYEASVGVDFDSLEMVYALDPTERYDSMYLSDDGKRIRLHTWQGDDLMLTVIDIATMTQLQKVKLLTASGEYYNDVISYDNFILIINDWYYSEWRDQITVWEQLSDGTFGHAFSVGVSADVFPEGSNLNLFDEYSNAVDYENGKLVVLKHCMLYPGRSWNSNYCDFYVAVYDATGLIYAGTCEWNLTRINTLEPYGKRIKPFFNDALEVSW